MQRYSGAWRDSEGAELEYVRNATIRIGIHILRFRLMELMTTASDFGPHNITIVERTAHRKRKQGSQYKKLFLSTLDNVREDRKTLCEQTKPNGAADVS